jgi:hypothetical protein
MPDPSSKQLPFDTTWFTIGIAGGVAVGLMTDNLGLWLPLGVVFALLGPAMFPKKEKKDE